MENRAEFLKKHLNPLQNSHLLKGTGGVVNAGNVLDGGITSCGGSGGNLRRPLTSTALTTTGIHRRRVIKKHIQQKYLLCGFVIHAFLCTPAYLYGNVVESDKDLVMRIWPAIVYQATGELCRSIFEYFNTEYHGHNEETTKYRRVFLLATLITCCSIMISGILFSSAWIRVTITTQIIAIIFYGFFGGFGSSLFIWKTHVILEAVRPREDKFVRKTIHLCGEAFCQLCLSFAFTNLRTLYGTAQSIILMSALLVNLIPISLIITRHRQGIITQCIPILKTNESTFHHQHFGRLSNNLSIDQLDGIEMKTWKNPSHINANANNNNIITLTTPAPTPTSIINDNFNFILPLDDMNVTFLNANGVEIMEIIPEEDDENVSVLRSSSATISNYGGRSVDESQTIRKISIPNSSIQNVDSSVKPASTNIVMKLHFFFRNITVHLWSNFYGKTVKPLSVALCVPKLYITTYLLSSDIFSYIMCLTVLPGLAVSQHAIKNAEIPFLFSLLAFPWMCFSLMTPRFGNSLYKHKMEWHSLGCLCKGLALTFISFSNSKLLLSVSAVLLGFGQAVTMFLHEWVFQLNMTPTHWMAIRFPVHLTNALLIVGWGALAHWIVVHFSFQASVGLAAVLYEERKANGRLVAVILASLVIFLAIYHAWIRKSNALASILVPVVIMVSFGTWVIILTKRDRARRALFGKYLEEVALRNRRKLETKAKLKQRKMNERPRRSYNDITIHYEHECTKKLYTANRKARCVDTMALTNETALNDINSICERNENPVRMRIYSKSSPTKRKNLKSRKLSIRQKVIERSGRYESTDIKRYYKTYRPQVKDTPSKKNKQVNEYSETQIKENISQGQTLRAIPKIVRTFSIP